MKKTSLTRGFFLLFIIRILPYY